MKKEQKRMTEIATHSFILGVLFCVMVWAILRVVM